MKILIIGLSNLGDALLTTPAIQAVCAAHPDAEVHALASPRTQELFETDPRISRVWIWKKRANFIQQAALIARLCGQRFGLVVDFRNSLIPLFLVGAQRTPIFRRRAPEGEHRAATHLRLVSSLGISTAGAGHRLSVGSEEQIKAKVWVQTGRPIVLMVPGARSHLKRWGSEGFAQVADLLIQRHGAQVILVGEESERPIAEEVKKTMHQPATDLTGRTTIRELMALLANTHLMITNDSACLHAAELMGVPSVAIFGPTDEKKYGPRNRRSVVVRRTLVCAPCELALCPYGHECMKWVTADEVYTAASKILSSSVHPELVEGQKP